MTQRIEALLRQRGATVKSSAPPDPHRGNVARVIAKNYPAFDRFRNELTRAKAGGWIRPDTEEQGKLWRCLVEQGFAEKNGTGGYAPAHRNGVIEFLTGGWLEDLAYEAVIAAGADAALCRVKLWWEKNGYRGHNELDVIARRGDRLIFFSCKCARASLELHGTRTRNQLMQYLHETDNLPDHFGDKRDAAVLLVTTDLVDERRNRVRYPALFGKAEALDVTLIPLEELGWRSLVARMRALLER